MLLVSQYVHGAVMYRARHLERPWKAQFLSMRVGGRKLFRYSREQGGFGVVISRQTPSDVGRPEGRGGGFLFDGSFKNHSSFAGAMPRR